MPVWVVITVSLLFLIGYMLYAEVLRENAYLSRTVEVQNDQQLIDTGLYSVVRHPMYTATLLMFLSMPLILGSWWALLIFFIYPILIIKRIQNEEQVLREGLKGYNDYQQRVRWRLIPYVW
jgi:protein-S-isoprenylcysteine O-methyltransferase Ste14